MSESSSDDRRNDSPPRSRKKPMEMKAKRGLAYSQEDALDSSSYDEKAASKLILRFPMPPKRLKTIYTVTMEIYSQTTEIQLYTPLFESILDFIKSHHSAVTVFSKLLRPHLTSKQFLGLRLLCKTFRSFMERVFYSKIKFDVLFDYGFSSPPWGNHHDKKMSSLMIYTYRTLYKQLLTTYAKVGQTNFKVSGKRRIPLPIEIPLQGTMEAFSELDIVIKAIADIFANNTSTQRRGLKRILDSPIDAIKAQKVIDDAMELYPQATYKTNFHCRSDCFTLHLEAKLFILMQCPQLLDFPDYQNEVISSPNVVKNLVREINDILYCLQITTNLNYVSELIDYVVDDSVIKQLLVTTACFRGASLNDWDNLNVEYRDEILRVSNAKYCLEVFATKGDFDDWTGNPPGSVIIKTCRELLKIKDTGQELHGFVVGVINMLTE